MSTSIHSQTPADYDLQKRVLKFALGRGLQNWRDVHIEANGSTVTLHGRFASLDDRRLCRSCAQHVVGVRRVIDKTDVDDRD